MSDRRTVQHSPSPSSAPATFGATDPGAATYPFARRAASFARSPWAAVTSLLDRHPAMIYFGDGMPARDLMPVARLREASARAWDDAPAALEYGDTFGWDPLRDFIVERMARQGMVAARDQIMVTTGAQQGLDLLCKLLLDPGDLVVVEGPTYLGALQTFDAYEATYLVVPVDADGMRVDQLEQALASAPRPPKLIYTIPTFQNPSGDTLSRQRRHRLLALAHAHGVALIEDDPYGELRFAGAPQPPLRALDPRVLYLGTFSKTIAPGLRVGWIAAPEALLPLLMGARESADLHSERISMRTVYHAAHGFLDTHLAQVRTAYRARRDAMLAGLRAEMPPGARWSHPEGGFFVWLELPPGLSADDLLPRAADRGVLYLPASFFYPHGFPHGHPAARGALRLNFSTLPAPVIAEGIRRLGAAIRDAAD